MGRLGIQLYTVKDEAEKDYFGTIRKLAEMGYEGIEFHGGTMAKSPARELKIFLDDLKFELIGLVFGKDELENQLDKVLQYCKDCKCTVVLFPWIDEKCRTAEGYKEFAEKFNFWGRKFKENGIQLLYHTHGYEFENLNGKTGMEILMENTDPEYFNLEIDVYWVEWGGVDAVQFMKKYGNRSPYIHFKDMRDRETKHDVEVGDGCIDMLSIARIGKENNAEWFIVEQEEFDMPSLKSAEISLKNLKRIVKEM